MITRQQSKRDNVTKFRLREGEEGGGGGWGSRFTIHIVFDERAF